MRDRIPTEISNRCTFVNTQYDQHNHRITAIKPIEPCPCGRELNDIRRVRLARTAEPQPHWREYCTTCRLVSIAGANDWMLAKELNIQMRSKNNEKIKKD